MREIKFRAWDSKNKEFVYEFYINSNRTDYIQIIPEYLRTRRDSFIMTTNDDYELNQYTGLKDKNGKEIYEGDIVRHLPTAFNSSSGVGEIYFHKGHARFGLKWIGYMEHYLDSLNSYEIIGNVYENPELLSTQPSQE